MRWVDAYEAARIAAAAARVSGKVWVTWRMPGGCWQATTEEAMEQYMKLSWSPSDNNRLLNLHTITRFHPSQTFRRFGGRWGRNSECRDLRKK